MRPTAVLLAVAALVLACAPVAAARDSFRGRLDIRHTDDMAHGKSSTRYTLRQPGRKRVAVRPAKAPNFPSGSRVVVRGRKRGRVIAGDVRPRPGVRPAAAVPGDYRLAVLLFNFADDRSQPWTPTAVNDRFFTASDSLDVYFKEQSWDQVNLEGDVYGWYDLGLNGAGCDVDAWADAAQARATAAGVALGTYDSIAYIFPDQADCSWAGLAELPGNELWLNGDITQRVASHELGHNMGVHHASALACSRDGVGTAISSSCSKLEYGDPFSSMGSSNRRMAGWHLQQLGYMQAANVQTVTADGTYSVRTTLGPSPEPQLLKIPRSTAGEYYYVDLRAGGGVFDTFAVGDPAVNGVTVRIGYGPTERVQSKLIDTTPDSYSSSSSDFLDAPLAAGRTFSDGDVTIKTVAVSGGVATVEVSWPGQTADTQPPAAPVITEATHRGSHVDVAWNASSDDTGVTGYRVRRDGSTIATVTGTSYRDAAVREWASYTYCVEAFDAAGNATRSASCWDSGRYVPPDAPPDETPPPPPLSPPPPPATTDRKAPVVKIHSPGRNARLRRNRRVKIRARATDDTRVAAIELWIDGVRLASNRGARLNLTWRLNRVRPGRHVVTVLARDAAGNASKRSVAVRVRR